MNLQIEDKGAAVLLAIDEERLDAQNSGELKNQRLKRARPSLQIRTLQRRCTM